jgi:uncharacterized membrane protein YgcG
VEAFMGGYGVARVSDRVWLASFSLVCSLALALANYRWSVGSLLRADSVRRGPFQAFGPLRPSPLLPMPRGRSPNDGPPVQESVNATSVEFPETAGDAVADAQGPGTPLDAAELSTLLDERDARLEARLVAALRQLPAAATGVATGGVANVAPDVAEDAYEDAVEDRADGGGDGDGGDDDDDDGGAAGDRAAGGGGAHGIFGAGFASEAERDVAEEARATFAELFGGHELPCAHYVDSNPFPRATMLRARTSHYKPAAAGDTVSAEVYDSLGAAGRRELCTAVPLASYLFDLVASVGEFEATVRGARGPLPRAEVLELLDLLGTQASSCFSFLQERLDELEGLSKDGLRAASFEPMYGNERSQSGARSRLGQALHASHLSRRHTRISSAAAAADVRAITGTAAPQPHVSTPRVTAATLLRGVGGGGGGGGTGTGGGSGGGGGLGQTRTGARAARVQRGGEGARSRRADVRQPPGE